jgi:hypothetical protein
VEEPTVTKSKKGAAGQEFNKDHALFFFSVKGIVHLLMLVPCSQIFLP